MNAAPLALVSWLLAVGTSDVDRPSFRFESPMDKFTIYFADIAEVRRNYDSVLVCLKAPFSRGLDKYVRTHMGKRLQIKFGSQVAREARAMFLVHRGCFLVEGPGSRDLANALLVHTRQKPFPKDLPPQKFNSFGVFD